LLGNSFCRPPWMMVREAGLVEVQNLLVLLMVPDGDFHL
jgi:hypothetical protein